MLVLTRKVNEQVLIGDDVVVTIVASKNGAVRLGIDAPQQIKVMRAELVQENTDENTQERN